MHVPAVVPIAAIVFASWMAEGCRTRYAPTAPRAIVEKTQIATELIFFVQHDCRVGERSVVMTVPWTGPVVP